MNKLLLSAALLISASAPAFAGGDGMSMCDMRSDYSLRLRDGELSFHRESGTPSDVRLQGGRLYVDGTEVTLSAGDRARIARIEREVRALIPEIKTIALEGVALAGVALTEVARAFDSDAGAEFGEKITAMQQELAAGIDQAIENGEWNEHRFERDMERMVSELAPAIAGDIAGAAVAAALSGDEEQVQRIERRAQELERTIEREVKLRAGELEKRADALCPRIAALAELEAELELRLPDGQPLDLLEM